MNELERQILKNQKAIMESMLYPKEPYPVINERNKTDKLLDPDFIRAEDCCGMGETRE